MNSAKAAVARAIDEFLDPPKEVEGGVEVNWEYSCMQVTNTNYTVAAITFELHFYYVHCWGQAGVDSIRAV